MKNIKDVTESMNQLVDKYDLKFVSIGRTIGLVRKEYKGIDKNEYVQMNAAEAKKGNFSPVMALPIKKSKLETSLGFYKYITWAVEEDHIKL